MEGEAATNFITVFAEYGPGWIFAAGVLVFGFYVVKRLLSVWEGNQQEKTEQNRQLVEISGRMVDQMDRSNTVIESVEKQMSVMNNTNATMVEALTRSQDRSQAMQDDTKTILDRVNFLYERTIKGGLDGLANS